MRRMALSLTILWIMSLTATVGVSVAMERLPESKEKGAYLGVVVNHVDEVLRKHLKLGKGEGLYVQFVAPDSPAAKAGVRKDDLLMKLDDQVLVNASQLQTLVRMQTPGQTVQLSLIREGEPMTVAAELIEKEIAVSSHALPEWLSHQKDVADWNKPPRVLSTYALAVKDASGKAIATWPPDLGPVLEELRATGAKLKALSERTTGEVEEVQRDLKELVKEIHQVVKSLAEQAGGSTNLEDLLEKLTGDLRGRVVTKLPGNALRSLPKTWFDAENGGNVVTLILGKHQLVLGVKNDERHLGVIEIDTDRLIFLGSVQTDEQLKGLPPEIRSKLEEAEKLLSSGKLFRTTDKTEESAKPNDAEE